MLLKNKKLKTLENFCKGDPVRHAFTLWDLRVERSNTEFYVEWEKGIRGYMLIYHGAAIPSVIIYGDEESAKNFLDILEIEKGIIHMPYELRHLWRGKRYRILIMARKPARFKISENVVEIKDASLLTSLFQEPSYLVEKARTWGILKDGKAISSVSALSYLPEVWVLGALITKREYRRMGYAKTLIAHFLNEAYGKTENVVLWVRDDNYPAIELYRKFGFKTVGEDVWINVGVDIIP